MPRIYGSPKIHKDNCPLRPIVEGIGSVTYNLQKALKPILKPIEGDPEFYIKDSKDLVTVFGDVVLDDDETLISHDVVGLFTNVCIEQALQITQGKLEQDTKFKTRTNMTIADVMEVLALVLRHTYFSYKGVIYQQMLGIAMGGPISPIIANIVMDFMFRKCVTTVPPELKPKVTKKFVDDSLSAVKKNAIKPLTDHMNKLDPTGNITYTIEMPENNQIPCLDALFHIKPDGTLKTSVYRKKTHTDQYLNFSSHHPLHHKQGVVRTLIDRAESIITDPEDKAVEYEHISKALVNCGYPKRVIRGVIRRRNTPKETSTTSKRPKDVNYGNRTMVTVPYVQGLSEKVQRIFKRHGVQCALKPNHTLRSMLVRPKDTRPRLDTSHLVYKIPCANCDTPYIGETGRHLRCRLKEHQDSVKTVASQRFTRSRKSQAEDKEEKSALADHAAQRNHVINWDKTSVLASQCHNKKGRWIREAIHVRAHGNGTLNRNQGMYELPHTWDSLLMTAVNDVKQTHNSNSHQS